MGHHLLAADVCDWCHDAEDPWLTRHWCLRIVAVGEPPSNPDDVIECSCGGKHYR